MEIQGTLYVSQYHRGGNTTIDRVVSLSDAALLRNQLTTDIEGIIPGLFPVS
jgi:hypothetical protein